MLVGIGAIASAGLQLSTARRVEQASGVQGPAFRAAFELTDHRGMNRTEEDFAGRWMLVFSGFTNCPDVFPATLSEVAAVMEGPGDEAAKMKPTFISIDPERDTPATLAEFESLFNAGIIGLNGTLEQIAAISEIFPIFFERIEEATTPNGYTMSHTSHLFRFDPESGFAMTWPYGTPAEEIPADLRKRS